MARILIVDDDPDIRETLALLLEAEGHDVVCAAHGAEALQLLRGGVRPCVILLDLMMPVMDGFQFRAQQAQDASISAFPVVAITAAGSKATDAIDVDEVLPKPFGLDGVRATIARYC